MKEKPPFYRSGSWLAFMSTLAALALSVLAGAPEGVTSRLADAVCLALPVLVGGRALVDHTRTRAGASAPGTER